VGAVRSPAVRRVAVLLATGVLLAGCSSTKKAADPRIRAGDIPAAVQAVEKAAGGPQRYTEINANTDGVTLFVASGDADEVSYFFHDGMLDPPGAPTPRQDERFALDGIPLDVAAQLVDRIEQQFKGAVVTKLALIDLPDQGLGWALTHRSASGGLLNSFYSPTGEVKVAVPADGG
jgi:hypothetical protein